MSAKDRFDSIVQKWYHTKIPEHIGKLMTIGGEPAQKFISEYPSIKRKADNLSVSETTELAKKLGASVGLMNWFNFILGVEFADEIREVEPDSPTPKSRDGDTVFISLDFEEYGVLDASIEASKQMILKKTKLAKIPLNRQESDVVDRIADLQIVIRGGRRGNIQEDTGGQTSFKDGTDVGIHSIAD